ncbi:MAG: hypothetical protein JSR90_16245 [Proteobacteria bacterium]|nr:hypothetical protein [Pseudomonadota bacterium]
MLKEFLNLISEHKQKESGRALAAMALALLLSASPGLAQEKLDAGGLTFKDFATQDRGASFDRRDPMLPEPPGPAVARVLEIDSNKGLARIRFEPIKAEISVPLGWRAFQEPERGTAFNADRSYRLLVWRLDFPFEGVRDAEHYAATKGGTIRARHPSTKVQAHKLADGTFLIIYENAPPAQGDQEARTVFDVVIPDPNNPKAGLLMTLGVPMSQTDRGLKLAALLKKTIKVDW